MARSRYVVYFLMCSSVTCSKSPNLVSKLDTLLQETRSGEFIFDTNIFNEDDDGNDNQPGGKRHKLDFEQKSEDEGVFMDAASVS